MDNKLLNAEIAVRLGWHVEYTGRACAEDNAGGYDLIPPAWPMPDEKLAYVGRMQAATPGEAWEHAPDFAGNIVYALWAIDRYCHMKQLRDRCLHIWQAEGSSNWHVTLHAAKGIEKVSKYDVILSSAIAEALYETMKRVE